MDLKQKRILVTGACGTVGKELVQQLLNEQNVAELIALDNNESDLFALEQQFGGYDQATFFLADVRDRDRLNDKMKGIDFVLDLAEKTPDVKFHLIGKTVTDRDDRIEKEASRRSLHNVRRFPWVEERNLSKYLSASDVLIIPPTALIEDHHIRLVDLLRRGKLHGLIDAGVPVLRDQT